jgi:hypothetical protein
MWKQTKSVLVLVWASIVALCALAATEAGADEGKWYAGAGLGLSRLEPEQNGSIYLVDDKSSAGFKLTLGYEWSAKLSLEGYYSDLGEAMMSPYGEVSYQDLGASGLYHIYQQHDARHKGFEAFIKAGFGRMNNDTELPYERIHNSHLMLGLGSSYAFDSGLSLRADLDLYDKDSQFLIFSIMQRFGSASDE